MTNFGPWATFAETNNLHQLVHMIYTNRDADSVTPNEDVAAVVGSLPAGSRVLDFGCGVCRNAADYAIWFPHIEFHGYDSPQMVARVGEFVRHKHGRELQDILNLTVRSDWGEVSAEKFDCVYATLVFQHIHPDEIAAYLTAIKKMTPLLLIHGRRANDYLWGGSSTWRVIEACGLVPSNAEAIGYHPDGAPEDHIPLCIYEIK